MAAVDAPYVAFFCPVCGAHLNEQDLDSDAPPASKYTALDGLVTCGWCHEPGQTYSHVIACRSRHKSITMMRHDARALDLARLAEELLR